MNGLRWKRSLGCEANAEIGEPGMLLNVAELDGVDDFFAGEDVGDYDQPGACADPFALF